MEKDRLRWHCVALQLELTLLNSHPHVPYIHTLHAHLRFALLHVYITRPLIFTLHLPYIILHLQHINITFTLRPPSVNLKFTLELP